MSKFTNYLSRLVKSGTGDSSKSFALLLSAFIGSLAALVLCFVLVYDIAQDGILSVDLSDAGMFLLCCSGFIFGGGVNKVLGERYENIGRKRHRDDEGCEE